MRTSPHFLTEYYLPCLPGVFTGAVIRMISDMRAKDEDSVNLSGCGKFTLAEDLSDISDMTRIDLSDINSLEGEPLEKFPGVFCAHVPNHPLRVVLLSRVIMSRHNQSRHLRRSLRSGDTQFEGHKSRVRRVGDRQV